MSKNSVINGVSVNAVIDVLKATKTVYCYANPETKVFDLGGSVKTTAQYFGKFYRAYLDGHKGYFTTDAIAKTTGRTYHVYHFTDLKEAEAVAKLFNDAYEQIVPTFSKNKKPDEKEA